MLDLLYQDTVPEPKAEDIGIFKRILEVIDSSEAKDAPGKLRTRIKEVFNVSLDELSQLMTMLSYAELLNPSDKTKRRASGDWSGALGFWQGKDKYDPVNVQKYFGQYLWKRSGPEYPGPLLYYKEQSDYCFINLYCCGSPFWLLIISI